jgi:preprotein translocase subunit SecA
VTGEPEVRGSTASNADDEFAEIGRNQLCPCGSGKKYKRCHGAPGGPTGLTARIS